ncbi:MAG: redoxin domain-containing protein [Planctomycetota bacterium]|nr:MAG: redoxin domain-containing protein [Planctomycetota bacterium]
MKLLRLLTSLILLISTLLIACTPAPVGDSQKADVPKTSEKAAFNKDAVFKEHLGKVLVVEVGQIGCRLSGIYLSRLEAIYPDLKRLGAEILRLSIFADENKSEAYRVRTKTTFKHQSDPKGEIGQVLGARLIPTMVVIGRFGYIRYAGGLKEAELETLVKELAAEKKPPKEIATGPPFKTGDDAPDFSAKTLKGEDFNLKKTAAANRITLIFYNALWCPFSRQALEQFGEMAMEIGEEDGIKLVLVNQEVDAEKLKEAFELLDEDVDVIPDAGGKVKKLYKFEGAPCGAVVGSDGKIVHYGHFKVNEFRKFLQLEGEDTESAFKDMFAFEGRTMNDEDLEMLKFVKGEKAAIVIFAAAEEDIDRMCVEEIFEWLKDNKLEGAAVVIIDESEDAKAAEKYYKDKKFSAKVIFDKNGEIKKKAGFEDTPYYFIVSPGGKIAIKGDEQELEKWSFYIKLLLAGLPLKPYVEESPNWG